MNIPRGMGVVDKKGLEINIFIKLQVGSVMMGKFQGPKS